MKKSQKTSLSMSEDELGILDATARRLGISRSEVLRHLILYQGLCGGDFPLTRKILELPKTSREKVVAEIRTRAETGDPAKPQSFRQWVKETLGKDDVPTLEKSSDSLLRSLLEEHVKN